VRPRGRGPSGSQAARPDPGKRILVELPDSLSPVLADELYLGQVLANLLENAIRYGGETIRVRGCDLERRLVQVSVEDDGRGVPDAALPHLFEKFYQAGPPGEAAAAGMGIGLTVVEGLTRAMEGGVGLPQRARRPARGRPAPPGIRPEQTADPTAIPATGFGPTLGRDGMRRAGNPSRRG